MAKRKIIWSNTAIKKLYAIFESDIREGNGNTFSVDLFNKISKQVKLLTKRPESGIETSDNSVLGLLVDSFIICYSISEDTIIFHTITEHQLIVNNAID